MSATVDFWSVKATIKDETGRWECKDDPVFEDLLNSTLPPDGASGSDPNPALTYAIKAANEFGGEVIAFDKTEGDEIKPPAG